MKRRHARRPPRHLPRRGEEGFTIIEVMMAAMVILIVMTSVGAVLVNSMSTVAYANQSQGADHLLDKTMEQVRALPFATLQGGLYNADPTVIGDKAITNKTMAGGVVTGGSYQTGTSPSQSVLLSGSQPPAPLYPHQTPVSQTTPSKGTYTVSVYPTAYTGPGPSGAIQITVVVQWNRPAQPGSPNYITGQTLVYPGQGCRSTSDHPFAAPCQPFFYSSATTGGGGITITPDAATGALWSNVLSSAELTPPSASVDLQSEQISSVSSSATPPGFIVNNGTGQTSYGGNSVNSYADNDPGTTSSTPYSSNTGPGATNGSQTLAGSNGVTITLSGSGSATGSTATATTVAGTYYCNDLRGDTVVTGLPCGYANSGTASPLTASIGVPLGAPNTLALTLASASESVAAFGGRTSGAYSYFCTASSSPGCVHAGTSRSSFTLGIGSLPSGLLTSLLNWSGSYVKISSGDSTSAESGIGPAAAQASSGLSVSTYNPTLGQYIPLTSNTPPAALNVSGVLNLLPVSVTMSLQNITMGTTSTTSTSCSATNCETATVTSPMVADLQYKVSVSNSEVFGATIHIDLGTERSSTTYEAAPSAS